QTIEILGRRSLDASKRSFVNRRECCDRRLRIHSKKTVDTCAAFVYPAELRATCGFQSKDPRIVGSLAQNDIRCVGTFLVAPGNEVRKRCPYPIVVMQRMHWIKAPGTRKMLKRCLRIADISSHDAQGIPRTCRIWVERD